MSIIHKKETGFLYARSYKLESQKGIEEIKNKKTKKTGEKILNAKISMSIIQDLVKRIYKKKKSRKEIREIKMKKKIYGQERKRKKKNIICTQLEESRRKSEKEIGLTKKTETKNWKERQKKEERLNLKKNKKDKSACQSSRGKRTRKTCLYLIIEKEI